MLQFPRSTSGHVVALVIVDHYSKWLAVVSLHDKKSSTLARTLMHRVFPVLLRIPDQMLSDNGPEFVGTEYVQLSGIFQLLKFILALDHLWVMVLVSG